MTSYVPIESGPVRLWVTDDALKNPDGVRFRVTARQAQAIASETHAMLPTAKISDLIWEQAAVRIPFLPADVVKQTDAEQSAKIDAAIAGRAGLVSSVGKDWVFSKLATSSKAVNYGGHVMTKASPHGPWPAQTTTARVWQQPGTAHNYDHADYSQLLRLVSRNVEVDGEPMDLVDVLTDPSLAKWVTDEGVWDAAELQKKGPQLEPVAYNEGAATPQPVGTIVNAAGIMRTSGAFRYAFWKMAQELGLNADYIAVMISLESGFRPNNRNPYSNASGINQVMPRYLKRAGITPEEFRTWTALEQLPWVRKQYAPQASKLRGARAGEYYLGNMLPAYVGEPDSLVVGANPGGCKHVPTNRATFPEQAKLTLDKAPTITLGSMYCGNWGFDPSGSGVITLGDIRTFFEGLVARAEKKPRVPIYEELPPEDEAGGGLLLGTLALLGLGLLAWRKGRS